MIGCWKCKYVCAINKLDVKNIKLVLNKFNKKLSDNFFKIFIKIKLKYHTYSNLYLKMLNNKLNLTN